MKKKIFLVDAIGATISVVGLVGIYFFEKIFGMPQQVTGLFIIIGFLLAIYSFSCYFLGPSNWRLYLGILALLNIGYCLFTISQMVQNAGALTWWGYCYFTAEILIILMLSAYELYQTRNQYSEGRY